jgi:Sulfotransferase domain
MRPTFLVIGAAKAGTTSLSRLLSLHPDVFVTDPKELHFFSFDEVFARGRPWYEAHFARAGAARARGEASTTYTVRKLFPLAPERIAAYGPELKLIYIARDPLERMESVWLQLRHFFTESPFIKVGVQGIPPGMQVDGDFNLAVRRQADCIVESTNYWRELAEYRGRFPDSQILVLLFEDLAARPRETLRRCFEFLGVDPDWPLPEETVHLNRSSERLQPREALWRLWASPRRRKVYQSLVGVLPQRVRDSFAGVLGVRAEKRPVWDEATRAWALERLGEDSARFLEHCGAARDVWPGLERVRPAS